MRCLRGDSGPCRLLRLSLPPLWDKEGISGYRPPPGSHPPNPHHPNYAMRLLSLSLTLTCQVRGAGSHVATPGLCLRGCQDLPGAGSYGAPVWTGGWECPPGLEQGACWLSLSASSGFQPAVGSGVATGVAPCPRGSHPWQQAAREENMAEEGSPKCHGQQGQYHGLGWAMGAGAGSRRGVGMALSRVESGAGALLLVQHGLRRAGSAVQWGAASAGVTGRVAAGADPHGRHS